MSGLAGFGYCDARSSEFAATDLRRRKEKAEKYTTDLREELSILWKNSYGSANYP